MVEQRALGVAHLPLDRELAVDVELGFGVKGNGVRKSERFENGDLTETRQTESSSQETQQQRRDRENRDVDDNGDELNEEDGRTLGDMGEEQGEEAVDRGDVLAEP